MITEEQNIVNAIAAHHEDKMPESVYDYIVQAADALSGARPGARKESLENYVKRLEDLEKIANSFEGVTSTYAIQAGREVRVIVESDKISDDRALIMSKEIAEQIDENVRFYAGPVTARYNDILNGPESNTAIFKYFIKYLQNIA